MSIADYNDLYKKQNGRCAICPRELPEGFSKHIHIDHNHETGVVRGLLCGTCNLMLGHAKDDIETLLKAVEYLKLTK